MIIEVSEDKTHVVISLGKFRILIGKPDLETLRKSNVFLLTRPDLVIPESEIFASGVRPACIYPHALLLSASLRHNSHVFRSFNEPLPLPSGWTVKPVSSGTFCTNWLLTHADGQTVLVTDASSVVESCLFRPIFRPSKLDVLVILRNESRTARSVQELHGLLEGSIGSPLSLKADDIFTAVAVCNQLVREIASKPQESQRPVRLSLASTRVLDLIPQMFEWLNEDMQIHIQRCVSYTLKCDHMHPLLIGELVDADRLRIGPTPDGDAIVIVDIDENDTEAFSMAGISSSIELESFLNPGILHDCNGLELIESVEMPVRNGIEFAGLLSVIKRRFPDAESMEIHVRIPSAGVDLMFEPGKGLSSVFYTKKSDELVALIQLLS